MSRREREQRRADRLLIGIASTMLISVVGVIAYLAPGHKPAVTVYMRPDCESCRSWATYLETRGFRIELGPASEWPAVRARFKLPPGFRGLHTAAVEGLLLEGHVPAREIHAVLAKPDRARIRGLVVPGLPRGAPGLHSVPSEPYTVFAVLDSGLMRPIGEYHHGTR